MPKRTNPFQQLVHLIEGQLVSHEATVTESREFIDQVTGQPREVDIVIETKVGTHPFVIGIECVDRNRPMGAPWIEQIHNKHQDLGDIDKTIVVSKSGFTKPALKKAKQRKIEALTLNEARGSNWVLYTSRLASLESINVVSTPVWAAEIRLKVMPPGPPPFPPPPQFAQPTDQLIYDPTGKPLGGVGEQVDLILNDPAFRSQIEEQINAQEGAANEGLTIHLELDYFNGNYVIDSTGAKQKLAQIVVKVGARRVISVIPLKKANYGSASLLHGAAEHLGHPVQLAWTEESDGRMILGASIREPKSSESGKRRPRKGTKQRRS
jgi:hypothetical protein